MNKTLSIGLAGFSFTIEEHAYIKLSDYLNALRSSLDASEADEVMHDIEIRMVEIFRDSLGKREVINDTDIEKVIAQIGSPEKIEEQEEAYYSEKNIKPKTTGTSYSDKKQLFRDPERQKIAGVCGGLAAYFGIDISVMRLIWIGAFLFLWVAPGSSFLIIILYFVLWAVLPKAETASDFLKMKGKPLNFDNLKEESGKIVQFANETTTRAGEIYTENKPYIKNLESNIINILKYIIGILFTVLAVGSIISILGVVIVCGLFGFEYNLPVTNDLRFYFDIDGLYNVLVGMMIIGCLIPAVLFSLLSIKIFSPKTKLKNVGWVLGVLFLILVILCAIFGSSLVKRKMMATNYKNENQEIALTTSSDSLYVDVNKISIPQNFLRYNSDIYSDKKIVYDKNFISVDVTRKENIKNPYLIIKKMAKGYNIPLDVNIPVEIKNNRVSIPNYIKYSYDQRLRNYHIDYELVVPQNMIVVPIKNDGIYFHGDLDNNGIDEHINGVEYNSDKEDSIIINGVKVPKQKAKQKIDSIK